MMMRCAVEPLKPETIGRVLRDRPHVAPEEIEEYQRLLSERFTADPSQAHLPHLQARHDAREARLKELYRKLFGPDPARP
jgi:hypothetical protein